MKKCVICWKDIKNNTLTLRCQRCYCNLNNDKKTKEYMKDQYEYRMQIKQISKEVFFAKQDAFINNK